MFATFAMFGTLAFPILFFIIFIFMIRSNKIILSVLPLALVIVFLMKNWNQIEQCGRLIARYSLIPLIVTLVVSLYIGRKWGIVMRLIFTSIVCVIACIVPIMLAAKPVQTNDLVKNENILTSFKEAKIYRYKGEALQLNGEQIAEFQTLMTDVEIKRDLSEKSKGIAFDDSNAWYCIEGVLEDGTKYQLAFFPWNSEPELMRVMCDGNFSYYQATEEQEKLASDWINGEIEGAKYQAILEQYREALRKMKDSFSIEGTVCSFTIPEELTENLEIEIIGLPDERNTVVYFLDENNENQNWKVRETYSFDVSNYASYRYIHMTVHINEIGFDLVNIFDYLPESMKSKEPQDRFDELTL